jgi:N-acetylneuraminic acid mutarotase
MPGPWVPRPPLSTARGGLDSVVDVDGRIYAIGGFGTGFDPIHKSVEVRDPATEQWTFVEPMLRPRGNQGAAYVEGRIYVVGGFDGPKSVTNTGESFDPSTKKWTEIKNRQRGPIAGPGATAFDGRVYLIGGGEQGGITDSISIYDPTTDKWSHDTRPMPTARYLLRAVTLDTQLYAVGGVVGDNQPFSSALERYDPIADTWISLRPMSVGRGNPGVAVAADGRIIVDGG